MSDSKTILVTGGCGFIGSNFIPYFLDKNPSYRIVNLDLLTYAGNTENLEEIVRDDRYLFVYGDIKYKVLLRRLFSEHNFDGVINFAAESHVDNSIQSPEIFLDTNIKGTFNLLEACRNHGKKNIRFHHISTDEVYGSLNNDSDLFTEETAYAPNSPYSVSKASSDFLVRSYTHTYGLNTVISNCSNNYGPKQHSEKLIPKTITRALLEQEIPIYGNGSNIRDWLYVQDHCEAIDMVFHYGKNGESYNVGSNNERDNNSVVNIICDILDKKVPKEKSYRSLIKYVEDRKGHDRRYGIDANKIKIELGWTPKTDFLSGIERTVNWYLNKNINATARITA